MYKFTWDSQITPPCLYPAPPTCALSRLHFGIVHRGLALEGRNLEEGEVLLPSPHRYLQRVLSLLNGTIGQKAKYLHSLSVAAQIPDVFLRLFLFSSSSFLRVPTSQSLCLCFPQCL